MTVVDALDVDVPGVTLERLPDLLLVRSERPLALIATAPVGAEHLFVRSLLNIAVAPDFDACDAPEAVTDQIVSQLGAERPYAAMLTAVPMHRAVIVSERDQSRAVFVVATVGIGNATRPGEERWSEPTAGTINLMIIVDANLSSTALHECLTVAAEAKALTIYESGVRTRSGSIATGTSTDAMIVAATQRGVTERYAGTVTPVGYLVGRAVRHAIARGLATG